MRVTLEIGKQFPELTSDHTDAFATEMLKLEDADFQEVILDMAGTQSICSMAMGSIFAARQKFDEQGRSLKMVNASPKVRRLIHLVNMTNILDDDATA